MSDPKLHHYVPRLYLRNFANEDGRLWVYDKQSDSVFPVAPAKIAAENDFNRLPLPLAHLGDPLSVESAFAKLESSMAPVLARMVAQARAGSAQDVLEISTHDRVLVTEFVASQYFRTLEMRELLSFLLSDIGSEFQSLSADEQKAALFSFFGSAGVIEAMSESIHEAVWIFAKNGSAVPLVTSDHPVCIKSRDSRTWVKGVDPLTDGRYIVLPLSPDVVMYCKEKSSWEALRRFDCAISPVILDAEMVEHENAGQAFAATRFLFSNQPDFSAVRDFIPSIGTDLYASDATPKTRESVELTSKYLASRAARRRT
jgi:hypothetical protein